MESKGGNIMKETYPDILITREAPLVIKDPYAQMHYGTVAMAMGAYIEIRAGVRFQIEKLIMADEVSESGTGKTEDPMLDDKEQPRQWRHHIIVTGEAGRNGENGRDGTEWGGSGENGLSAPGPGGDAPQNFTLTIRELGFDLAVLSTGGAGGSGGNGGNGSNGYDGTSESDPGGAGGDGGSGGNGGNGGNAAALLTIQYASSKGCIVSAECAAAEGGNGGRGGIQGRNGKYYKGSIQPARGADGSKGITGKAGKISVETL